MSGSRRHVWCALFARRAAEDHSMKSLVVGGAALALMTTPGVAVESGGGTENCVGELSTISCHAPAPGSLLAATADGDRLQLGRRRQHRHAAWTLELHHVAVRAAVGVQRSARRANVCAAEHGDARRGGQLLGREVHVLQTSSACRTFRRISRATRRIRRRPRTSCRTSFRRLQRRSTR